MTLLHGLYERIVEIDSTAYPGPGVRQCTGRTTHGMWSSCVGCLQPSFIGSQLIECLELIGVRPVLLASFDLGFAPPGDSEIPDRHQASEPLPCGLHTRSGKRGAGQRLDVRQGLGRRQDPFWALLPSFSKLAIHVAAVTTRISKVVQLGFYERCRGMPRQPRWVGWSARFPPDH